MTEPVTLTLARRYNGPPSSANGGYACGSIARLAQPHFGATVTVTLLAPPPLDTELHLRIGPRRAQVTAGDELIATVAAGAGTAGGNSTILDPVSPEQARAAEADYAGDHAHPFPTCFVCGTERAPGDGLLLRPGRLPGPAGATDGVRVACTWTPDGSLTGPDGSIPPEVVWSVLDCPGGWTGDPGREPAVLSRMTADLRGVPQVGETCVVVARLAERAERTAVNSTALYGADGRLLGTAGALWVRTTVAAAG